MFTELFVVNFFNKGSLRLSAVCWLSLPSCLINATFQEFNFNLLCRQIPNVIKTFIKTPDLKIRNAQEIAL